MGRERTVEIKVGRERNYREMKKKGKRRQKGRGIDG